jgi:hypothetical protein
LAFFVFCHFFVLDANFLGLFFFGLFDHV